MNIWMIFSKKKNGKILPDSDHIVRYCSPSRWDRKNREIFPSAFELTEKELNSSEPYLSCGHLEHYKNNAFGRVCCDIASIRNVSDRGCFCQLGIGKIKEIGRQANHNDIYINKLSNKKNPSYAGIFKTSNNLKLLVKLAVEATLSIKDE